MTKTCLLLADDHVLVRAGIRSLLEKMPRTLAAAKVFSPGH
jgi:DNA-binding NarL/FixJ family response regulator